MKKLLKNEKGVTVLEVVIAVAIFVAISIPVARAIAISAKYQYKSRIRQDINVTAESLMENFKAYPLDELVDKYNSSSNELLKGCVIDGNTSFQVTENSDDSIVFLISNVKIDNENYQISTKVTPVSEYSGLTLTSMDDFDSLSCAIAYIKESQGEAEAAILEDFKDNYAEEFLEEYKSLEEFLDTDEITVDDIDYSHLMLLSRTINVNVNNNGSSNLAEYYMTYSYVMAEYPYYKKKPPEVEEEEEIEEDEEEEDEEEEEEIEEEEEKKEEDYELKDFSFTTEPFSTDSNSFYSAPIMGSEGKYNLNRVYVYYYPMYAISINDSFEEKIEINNSSVTEDGIDLYLLKQKIPGAGMSLDIYEETYNPDVTIGGNTTFYHNLNYNLQKNTQIGLFSGGTDFKEALIKDDNTLLYTVDIEVKKDDTVWSKLSSTLKK